MTVGKNLNQYLASFSQSEMTEFYSFSHTRQSIDMFLCYYFVRNSDK